MQLPRIIRESGVDETSIHSYGVTGIFPVTLTVIDDIGLSDTNETTATIGTGELPPLADAGGPYTAEVDVAIDFDGSASVDPGGNIVGWIWTFGDGSSSSNGGATPSHTYSVADNYIVTLSVIDDSGAIDADGTVAVIGALPEPPAFPGLAGVADLNGNGSDEVAVMVAGGSTHVQIRDGNDDALISDIDFGDDPVSAMVVIDDISGNGMPEIAVLGTRPDNNVRVQVKDSLTGATVNSIFYGATFSALDMEILPDTDSNGADELLVLGTDAAGAVRIQARDALSDAETSTTFYGTGATAQGVLTIPDISGNAEPEVLMHGAVISSGQDRAQMKDASSRALVRNVFFGAAYVPKELVVIGDVSGDGNPDLAQLGTHNVTGATRISVKRTDTSGIVSNAYTGTDTPIAIVGIGDANGNNAPDVALLVMKPDGTAKVIVRDGATGAQIGNIFFGSVSNPVAIALVADLDMSGDPELAVSGDDGAGTQRVQIRDSISGAQINTIDYP